MPGWFRFRKAFPQKPQPPKLSASEESIRKSERGRKSLADFLFKKNKIPEGHVMLPRGRSFAQQNEQVMAIREKALRDIGITGPKAEKILYLFRIRKAAAELTHTLGFMTTESAAALLEFLQENRAAYEIFSKSKEGKGCDEEFYNRSISELKAALKYDSSEMKRALEEPLNESLFAMVRNADLALDPKGPMETRFVRGNRVFTVAIPFDLSEWMIKRALGDRYQRFDQSVGEKRKRLG